MKKYPFQQLPGLKNIEAEGKETIKLPTGEVYEIKGPSHARGGVKLFAPSGSKVFSQRLQLDDLTVENLIGKRKKMSPAEISKKFPTDKYIDILQDPTQRRDELSKKTATLMLEKNNKVQEAVFRAQEEFKFKKGMNNDLDKSNYQSGGLFGQSPYSVNQGIRTTEIDPNLSDTFRTVYRSTNQPYANDPYFTQGVDQLSGQLTGQNREILKARQEQLTEIVNYEGNDPLMQRMRVDYTKFLQDVDRKDPDKFLKKEIEIGGNRIPLSTATQDQIEQSDRTFVTNLRTGERTLVDLREGNYNEATSNQIWNPTLTQTSEVQHGLEPLETLQAKELEMQKTLGKKVPGTEPVPTETPEVEPEKVPVDIDPQKLINGLQAGLLLGDLASLQKANPYYTFRPTQLAFQRFEPLNTKQQERAFNIARESLENSNLPEAVKQAQLSQIHAQMTQGVNQIDAQNYQGNLQVQNQNTQMAMNAYNQDEQRRQESNLRYLQDEARGEYLYRSQRQVFRDQLFKLWREHAQNVSEQKLINQLSRNYNFNPYSQQVEYQPGKGSQTTYNQLQAFYPTK